jgi:hypothetical protein
MTGTNGKPEQPDSVRKRSPRYPIMAIDEAITKAKAIYDADRRAFATFDAVLSHMGYKVKEKRGGRSARVIATVKQYGLIEERDGKYRVSDSAFRIFELPEESQERTILIKKAALSPAMISKVFKHFDGELPSDTTLRSHLIFEEEFNPDSATEFVKVLRRTKTLVNPVAGDYNATDLSDDDDDSEAEDETPIAKGSTPMTPATQTPAATPPPPKPSGNQRPYPLYLSKEKEAVLYVPSVMTRSEYELLKRQIENSLLVVEATAVSDSEPSDET